MKQPLRGTRYNTRDEVICAIGRSIRNINKVGHADGVRCLCKIWQKVINKVQDYINDIHKCCTSVNKAMSEILNCCHYFLPNSCSLYKWFHFIPLEALVVKQMYEHRDGSKFASYARDLLHVEWENPLFSFQLFIHSKTVCYEVILIEIP